MTQASDSAANIAATPADNETPVSFNELGLLPALCDAVRDAGYTSPTPIQKQAIPVVMSGRDVMGGAQTGTGKTASFTLPLLHRLAPFANTSPSPARHPVRALILCPTRELAMQVHESVKLYCKYLPIRSACVYGGVDIKPQVLELREGREVVVATPGRLLDHVEQKSIQLNQVQVLVMDEADRMLDMGFIPDIKRILSLLPATRQSLLFSATFSNEIKKLADAMLRDPQLIEVARRNAMAETVRHRVLSVSNDDKRALLAHLLTQPPYNGQQALVFVNTKFGASRLAVYLEKHGIAADAIHGDKNQQQRTEALDKFKQGSMRVLVATDVAARGIDIDDLPFVINCELPGNAEDYVHRVGRTGRAGKSGEALTLQAPDEANRLADIEKLIKRSIERMDVPDFRPGSGSEERHEGHLRRERGERGERGERASSRERNERGTRRESGLSASSYRASTPPTIAADGFDFSKPYESSSTSVDAAIPASPASGTGTTPTAHPSRKPKAPVAFLLGGKRS